MGITLATAVFLSSASAIAADTTELSMVAATTLEAKLTLSESIDFPFLPREGPLTEGNSVRLKFGAELSPVSVNATFESTWTPIAFFQLVGGCAIGSGWNIPIADGLRYNSRSGLHDSMLTGDAFSGAVWSAKAGTVLQFDLAALRPGEWNHLVFRSYHSIYYRALSSASSEESWLYEADSGENRNGWNYYGNCFIGYGMPILIDMVGFLAEADLYLYDTPGRSYWGDDLIRWTFGPLVDFRLREGMNLALLVQLRTMRNFTASTEDYGFYQDRELVDGDPYRVEFYRVALTCTMRLR